MVDAPRNPDANGDVRAVLKREATIGTRPTTPRWVRVLWTITLAVVVLFVIGLLTKGPHVPGGQGLSGETGGRPSAARISAGHNPSPWGLG